MLTKRYGDAQLTVLLVMNIVVCVCVKKAIFGHTNTVPVHTVL
jgi:hypothetical protein